MALTPSLKISKSFVYRAGTRVWSNRYHLSGGTPANDAAWLALFNAVVLQEKTIFGSEVTIVGGTGYAAGSEIPVWSTTTSVAGTLAETGSRPVIGDGCSLIRYGTDQRTSKNHPVYLFNYVHGARYVDPAPPDVLLPLQKTKLEAYADAWLAGFSDGTLTYHRAGPNGAVAQNRFVSQYIHHRDFRN